MYREHSRLVDPEVVKTARRYRSITIQVGDHTITAAGPAPADLAAALDAIRDQPNWTLI